MEYLKIGGIDFSDRIQPKTYSVTKNKKYTEWTDSNERVHRDNVRTKIEGSFDLGFASLNDDGFKLFCNALENATTSDGITIADLWIQNESALRTTELFVEISKIKQSTLPNGYVVTSCSVKVVQP